MSDIVFRAATAEDIPAIVAMLADDHLGMQRESPHDLTPYLAAWRQMQASTDTQQIVGVTEGKVVATMQLTVIPGLSHQGASRLLIEAVRVDGSRRGGGIGTRLIEWAIAYGRGHGCSMVELTTNKSRADAHRFYERLGFEQSHFGYKMRLD